MLSSATPTNPDSDRLSSPAGSSCHGSAATAAAAAALLLLLPRRLPLLLLPYQGGLGALGPCSGVDGRGPCECWQKGAALPLWRATWGGRLSVWVANTRAVGQQQQQRQVLAPSGRVPRNKRACQPSPLQRFALRHTPTCQRECQVLQARE
jgi:hypothetical protein